MYLVPKGCWGALAKSKITPKVKIGGQWTMGVLAENFGMVQRGLENR